MLPVYSPTEDWANPTGTKPATVTSVPNSMGAAVAVQACDAARTRSQPCSILTIIISIEIMASSTSRPSAMISAPNVIRSRLIPAIFIIRKVRPSVTGMAMPTTSPARKPIARMLTAITTAIATRNLIWNRLTALAMALAWLVNCTMLMPNGSFVRSFSMKFCRRSPTFRPFSPFCITTPRMTLSWLPARIK